MLLNVYMLCYITTRRLNNLNWNYMKQTNTNGCAVLKRKEKVHGSMFYTNVNLKKVICIFNQPCTQVPQIKSIALSLLMS